MAYRTSAQFLAVITLALASLDCAPDASQEGATTEAGAQQADQGTSTPSGPQDGRIEDSTYTNDFFGFSMRFPSGWEVISAADMQRTHQMGAQVLTGDDPAARERLNEAEQYKHNLLMVMEHPFGAAVDFNPSLQIIAINAAAAGGSTDIRTHLDEVAAVLRQSRLLAEETGGPEKETLGGREAYTATFVMTIQQHRINGEYHVLAIDGFLLQFVLTYQSLVEREALRAALDTVTFV